MPLSNNHIKEATQEELILIKDIAYNAWPPAYKDIISHDQIDFMLKMMYDIHVLENQYLHLNHHFSILYSDKKAIGFVGYEHNYKSNPETKIHKLYLLPESKGIGAGKMLLNYAKDKAIKNESNTLVLNVNKQNPAYNFYLHYGFQISEEIVLDIGNGYVMDDYVMRMQIQ